MDTFTLNQRSITNVVYDNAACAESRQLKTSEIRYVADVFLDPAVYNDSQGYYVVWERCCRNNAINNIQNPGNVGMAFLFEFPAVTQNSTYFKNSSPDFKFPNGDYVCINRPFTFDMGATDSDGDELRYSLVTPLAGYSSTMNALGSGQSRASYPEVQWVPGISLANFIPGSRLPAINSKGILSLTASQPGLYVFAILVEEYRNGVKIGAVRREFQLPVVDCGRTTPPAPSVFENDTTKAIQTIEICQGASTEISTRTDANLAYQWKKDGANLTGEKSAKLKVNQPGDYQVIVSFAKTCSNDTASYIVRVTAVKPPLLVLNPSDTLRLCSGDTVLLRATSSATYRYEWFKAGTLIANQNKNTLPVTETGSYVLQARDAQQAAGCPARDTVLAISTMRPVARILANKNNFCPGDSLRLTSDWPTGQTGQWLKDNVPLLPIDKGITIKQAGSYRLKITNQQCIALSDAFIVKENKLVVVVFDSLQTVCYADVPTVALKATPTGGTFDGKGVENERINVKLAGIGRHAIRYVVQSNEGCTGSQTRNLVVEASPVLRLRNSTTIARGESLRLEPKTDSLDVSGSRYEWAPPTGLDNPNARTPTATPTQTTTYQLTVTSANGCQARATTTVVIADFIFIPDVFSPNDDGTNDNWEILRTDQYPPFEVYVYNRWGELIFYEKEGHKNFWNGTYEGKKVEAGVYGYVIRPTLAESNLPRRTGAVCVMR